MEMQFALVRQINEKKAGRPFPVIPLILPGATPEKGTGFLELYTWVDLRERLDDPAAIDELPHVVRGDVAQQKFEAMVEFCPYRALQAFREQDEKLFFGRDRFAEQLLEKARDEKQKFIAVVGASGSGKSSVVQAGLLSRLRSERLPNLSWESAIFTPGKATFHNRTLRHDAGAGSQTIYPTVTCRRRRACNRRAHLSRGFLQPGHQLRPRVG
jgi:hypothetical protein